MKYCLFKKIIIIKYWTLSKKVIIIKYSKSTFIENVVQCENKF